MKGNKGPKSAWCVRSLRLRHDLEEVAKRSGNELEISEISRAFQSKRQISPGGSFTAAGEAQ